MRTLPKGRGPLIPRQVYLLQEALDWALNRMNALVKRQPRPSRDDVAKLRTTWNAIGAWIDWLEERAE